VYGGCAYIPSTRLHCVEALTGSPVWRDPTISGDDEGCGATVVVTGDEKLLYLSQRGALSLAEPGHRSRTYTRLARVRRVLEPSKGQTWPHVALAEGMILVKDKTGNLACYAVGASPPQRRAGP
jgi:hypothetical protein